MLSGWNQDKCIQLRLDHNKVSEDLTDFPVLINLSATSGQNNYNATDLFDELSTNISGTDSYTNRKKIAIYDPGYQEHMVETVDDTFSGNNGDAANISLWTTTENGTHTVDIQGNKLRFDSNASTGLSSNITGNYTFVGDFDYEIDYSSLTMGTTANNYLFIRVEVDGSNFVDFKVGRVASGNKYRLEGIINSVYWGAYEASWSNIFGKLRVRRAGTTIGFYYKDGSASEWALLQANSSFSTSACLIRFFLTSQTGSDVYCDIDNFKLNYGTIDWGTTPPNYELKTYTGTPQQCYCEIENWDQANQEAQLWVKVPKVLYDQPTDLYLYYDISQEDNSAYIGDTGSTTAQSVWDSNFVTVYHMNQDPTAPFTPKSLYSGERSGSASAGGNPVAATSFTPVNIAGLTKANGVLKIDLKVSNTSYLDLDNISQLEITSYGSPDNQEWNYTMTSEYDPLDIRLQLSTSYKTFYIPLSYFNTTNGELDVTQIDYIRWYVHAINGTLTIYWRSAEIILLEPPILDSTSNSYDGTTYGGMLSAALTNTNPGKAITFDGTDDFIQAKDSFLANVGTDFTIELIIKSTQNTHDASFWYLDPILFYKDVSGLSNDYNVYLRDGKIRFHTGGSSEDFLDSTIFIADNNLHSVSCNRVKASGNKSIYIDGSFNVENTGTTNDLSNTVAFRLAGTGGYFLGQISEFRLSDVNRSEYWIKATYYSDIDSLILYSPAFTYHVDGYIKQDNLPVQRKVYLYNRATGELMDSTISAANGYYYLKTTSTDAHNVVCIDDDAGTDLLDLIASRVYPSA